MLLDAVKNYLIAIAFALGLGLGTWGTHTYTSRTALQKENTVLTGQVVIKEKVIDVTSSVLSARVQSSAAIQKKAQVVQLEIQKRLPEGAGTCLLSGDWRVLHDAATANEVPPAPGGTDAQSVTAKEAAATVADNYATALDTADRLDKLQQFVDGLSAK